MPLSPCPLVSRHTATTQSPNQRGRSVGRPHSQWKQIDADRAVNTWKLLMRYCQVALIAVPNFWQSTHEKHCAKDSPLLVQELRVQVAELMRFAWPNLEDKLRRPSRGPEDIHVESVRARWDPRWHKNPPVFQDIVSRRELHDVYRPEIVPKRWRTNQVEHEAGTGRELKRRPFAADSPTADLEDDLLSGTQEWPVYALVV